MLELDARRVPFVQDLRVHSRDSSDYGAFAAPQLLIKQGYQTALGRFQARLVKPEDGQGVLCSKSYVSATGPAATMKAACLAYNSLIAAYYMQLRSGRMAAYRPEANVHEILDVPLPPPDLVADAEPRTLAEIDAAVFAGFGLKEAERVLVEDMTSITIPDFRGDRPSPGAATTRTPEGGEGLLKSYCETFLRVMRAGFGQSKGLKATIFAEANAEQTPYRLVAIRLLDDESRSAEVEIALIGHLDLIAQLRRLSADPSRGAGGGAGQRLARFYDASTGTPTIFLLKPDATRYWTRSMALNDADQVSADLLAWTAAARSPQG